MRLSTILSIVLIVVLWSSYASRVHAATANNNEEDADLSFIPSSMLDDESESSNTDSQDKEVKEEHSATNNDEGSHFKYSFDSILQHSKSKNKSDLIFNLPNQTNVDWSNLTRFGVRVDTPVTPTINFKTELLLNAYTHEDDSFKTSEDLRLDIKEAYLSWQKSHTQYIDAGRINIKNGVASGFNPTDYFKVGSLLDRNTEDVSQLRDARMGALVLRGQKLWDKGSLTLIASPKITEKENHWSSNKDIIGLNLHKSNDRSRGMLILNHQMSETLSPEFIYYNESGKHNFGFNISQSFNNKWISYAEWNIGERQNLIDEALKQSRYSGSLDVSITTQLTEKSDDDYKQQFAVGASYTSDSNITTRLEYHYNEAALSNSDAKKWFNLTETANENSNYKAIGQLLSVRGLAQLRGELLSRRSLFLRTNWTDAGIDDLDLTGLLITDLNDQSLLMQVQASYSIDDNSEIALRFAKYQGDKKSIYGSLDQDYSVSLQYEYDF